MSSQHRWRIALLTAMFSGCALAGAAAQDGSWVPPVTQEASASHDDVLRAQDDAPSGDVAADNQAPQLDDATLGQVLNFDAATSIVPKTKMPKRSASTKNVDWSRSDAADGSSAYTVKQSLGTAWDSTFGADFSVPPSTVPSPVMSSPGNGAAWANVDVPEVATLGVRAEPTAGYNKVGSSVQRTVPVGSNYGVTLQSNVAVTELYASLASPSPAAQIWDTDNSVKFSVRSTGTAFSAGAVTSSVDPMTHTRLTAEQNLYGPLTVTGSLYDPGQATSATSIGAGLKFDW